MAEEIVIKTVLDLSGSETRLKQQVGAALNSPEVQTKLKETGKKWGDSLNLGIETTRRGREDAENRHLRKLEAIQAQSTARLVQIEARKQAQLDAIRERGVQKELEHARKIERETQRSAGALGSVRSAVAGIQGLFASLAAIGIVGFFENLARKAIDAAIAIDKQVNTLKALTGSAAAAQERFAQLVAISQKTPGLTATLAATLDTQLRIFNVSVQTIDKLLPVIGKLNAILPLGDPRQFVNNLTQLISQNFERQDLKELVGQSPIAGQLIKNIFNVDNPTNSEAIRASAKRLGVTTVERLAEELVKAANENSALKKATESLSGQFEKLQDRITVALAPIGEELLRTILPSLREFTEILERDGPKISQLLRDNREEFLALAAAVVATANAVGGLIGQFIKLDQQFGIIRKLSLIAIAGTNPAALGSLTSLNRVLGEGDAARAARDAALSGVLPSGISAEEFGGGLSGIIGLSPTAPKSVGGLTSAGGGSARVSKEARERAQEIKRTQEKILEAKNEFFKGIVSDLEEIEQTITGANIGNISRSADRPRQLAAFNAANIERLRKIDLETAQLERNTAEKARKELEKIEPILSNSERFMRGFASATETAGDAFERFGQSVSRAFLNVRDLFNGLKQAVLGFFNDLLGNALQNLVRNTLGGLLGGAGGRLGGIFGGLGGGTFGGNIFSQALAGAGGSGITVPTSISQSAGGTLGAVASRGIEDFFGAGVPRTAGQVAGGGGGFSFGGLLGGLASAAPLLGLGLGSGIGGRSTLGQIAGAVGGGAVGLGVSFGASIFGAGGGIGQAALAALGPIALIGAPLLIGGLLLGKAAQRRKDEQASGEFLAQALAAIDQLAAGVGSGQIPGAQARSIFDTQILGTFKQQIGGLQTKSVRDSRLTNQVRDLEAVYEARIPPLIAEQQRRAAEAAQNALNFSRQVPEFASGGTTRGGLALLHPGEKVVNLTQQSAMRAIGGPNIFERAGVPGPSQNRNFDVGGTMAAAGGMPVEVTLDVTMVVGKQDQTRFFVNGGSTPQGQAVILKGLKTARTDKEF